jgi:hypothetical protein
VPNAAVGVVEPAAKVFDKDDNDVVGGPEEGVADTTVSNADEEG